MKKQPIDLANEQIGKERRIATAILLFLALLLALSAHRSNLLKQTIYEAEKGTQAVQSMSDTSKVVKTIGKPFINYSKSVEKPTIKHFWKNYKND